MAQGEHEADGGDGQERDPQVLHRLAQGGQEQQAGGEQGDQGRGIEETEVETPGTQQAGQQHPGVEGHGHETHCQCPATRPVCGGADPGEACGENDAGREIEHDGQVCDQLSMHARRVGKVRSGKGMMAYRPGT